MDGYHMYPDPALRASTPWAVVASSFWLRVGFVAACVAVVALTELYRGEANPLAATAWIFGGAWIAALSWRRAKFLLDRLDDVELASSTSATGAQAAESLDTFQAKWDRRDVPASTAAPQARG